MFELVINNGHISYFDSIQIALNYYRNNLKNFGNVIAAKVCDANGKCVWNIV